MIHISKKQISAAVITIGFMGLAYASDEGHVTETAPCQQLMADFNAFTNIIERDKFLSDVRHDIQYSADLHKNTQDVAKAKKFAQLSECAEFLHEWPGYLSNLATVKDLLNKIDTKKAPAASIIDKAKSSLRVKELNDQQAYQLYNCEPCQAVKKELFKADGSFDKNKADTLYEAADRLSYISGPRTDYTDRKVYDKTKKPESVVQRAAMLAACINIIGAKRYSEAHADKLAKYLK